MKMKKLQAQFNNIIVKPLEKEESYGNIIVPDLGKEKALRGTIVSVGLGYWSATAQWIATTLKEGQEVILPAMGPVSINFENQEYWICPENMVSAIVEDYEHEYNEYDFQPFASSKNDDELPF